MIICCLRQWSRIFESPECYRNLDLFQDYLLDYNRGQSIVKPYYENGD